MHNRKGSPELRPACPHIVIVAMVFSGLEGTLHVPDSFVPLML